MFVRATYYREKKTVHYFDEHGEETLYIGGSFAWRTNNPGNMAKPGQRIVNTNIGYAQRTSDPKGLFLIFPDRATGDAERIRLLREVYNKNSIAAMIEAYAPRKHKGNDTDGYIAIVCKATGVDKSTRLDQLTQEQFDKLAAAMARHEGWIPGKIVPLGKPKTADLRDKLQQPLARQRVALKGGKEDITVKTDDSGALPLLYPKLFNDGLSLYLDGVDDKIGDIDDGSVELSCTFVAPYLSLANSAEIHDIKERPPQHIHIVQPRETLGSIAGKYPGVTIDALVAANNLKDPDKIFARQHLRIPQASSSKLTAKPAESAQNSAAAPAPMPKPEATSEVKQEAKSANKPVVPVSPTAAVAKPPAKVAAAPASTVQVDQQRTDKNHPITVLSSRDRELSGPQWHARFPGENTLDALAPGFRENVRSFLNALREGGVRVKVNAVYRPTERSYLMYWALKICRGYDVAKVPSWPGVNIDWVHRGPGGEPDVKKSKKAAEQMCQRYEIDPYSQSQLVGYPGKSNHNKRLAIDMTPTAYEGKTVKDGLGNLVKVRNFGSLKEIGETFDVFYFSREKMHWSWNGR